MMVIEEIELYTIVILGIITLWLIGHTIAFARGRKKIVKNLHRFAKEGEKEAQTKLARCYEEGEVVIEDSLKAAFWHQKASFSEEESPKEPAEIHNNEHSRKKSLISV